MVTLVPYFYEENKFELDIENNEGNINVVYIDLFVSKTALNRTTKNSEMDIELEWIRETVENVPVDALSEGIESVN